MIKTKSKHNQLGFTLPEVLVSLAITVPLLALGTGFLIGSWNNQSYVMLQAHIKTSTETGLNRLSRDVMQARRIFGKGAVSTSYLARLDMKGAPRPILNSALPDVRTAGSMSPEKNCEVSPSEYFLPYTVGNSLFFAELLETRKFTQPAAGAPRLPRDIDIYRLNYIYVTDYDGLAANNIVKPLLSMPQLTYARSTPVKRPLSLIEWHSQPMADYTQLKAYYDSLNTATFGADRSTISTLLANKGITIAWKRDENNVANAFYNISGTSLTLRPTGVATANMVPMRSYQDALRLQNTGEGTYTIAYNQEVDSSKPAYFPIHNKVPYYYSPTLDPGLNCPQVTPVPTATPAGNYDFPRGFETMVIGPQSGRSVHMRVTAVAKGYSKTIVEYAHAVTVSASDL